jgi:CO/xanthine dehydrogenase FAD-binding subunit
MKLEEVMLGPGHTALDKRYIAFIFLPNLAEAGQFGYYRKVGQRSALAISKVSLAVIGWREQNRIRDIRIATGSVTPQIRRAHGTEAVLRNAELTDDVIEQARLKLMDEVTPISDIRSTTAYRRSTCGALLAEALHSNRLAKV